MAASPSFATARTLLGRAARLLGGNQQTPSPALISYARQVQPLVERVERAYADWLAHTQESPNPEMLANTASVQRWELASAAEALAALEPPAEAQRVHEGLLQGLRLSARAYQLLSLGYRSTTYATVCDGHTLLGDAQRALRPIAEQLAHWAEPRGQVASPGPAPARQRGAS